MGIDSLLTLPQAQQKEVEDQGMENEEVKTLMTKNKHPSDKRNDQDVKNARESSSLESSEQSSSSVKKIQPIKIYNRDLHWLEN